MTTREVPWELLDQLVPANLDRYWQLTLEFLKIARSTWPELLNERGAIEPAARRDALIRHETVRLAAHCDGPVIAAGSTGSMPATAELIATIASLPNGAVVLPGLDLELDEASWALIGGRSEGPGASRALQQLVIRNSPCGRCCSGSASRANRSPCSARAGSMSASTS